MYPNCYIATQFPQFSNIRNPLIYYVNRYFLMFGGSQVQKSYRASTNDLFDLLTLISSYYTYSHGKERNVWFLIQGQHFWMLLCSQL